MNSFVYCTFLFCFLKIMIVRRFLNILDQHFCIAWTNWMNFKGMYYVVLLYDIMLRSWPPYPNLESEFLCHFPGPPMIICFPLFYTYSIQLIFQVKKGQFSLVGFNWLFVRFNWLWVSLNNHLRICFMFPIHVRYVFSTIYGSEQRIYETWLKEILTGNSKIKLLMAGLTVRYLINRYHLRIF